MKLSHQLSLCFVELFLLTAILLIGNNYVQAEEKPVAERLVTINLEDQDFTQALAVIADQAGITINIHGQTPAGKRDISINNMSLNEAMGHILRIYGVRNHAAAYNPDTGTVMLAILETSTMVAYEPKDNQSEGIVFLSIAELAILDPDLTVNPDPLSLDEIQQLNINDDADFGHPLTEEEMQKLVTDDEISRPLTSKEMGMLEPDEKVDGSESMTRNLMEDEMLLLEEDGPRQ
jgi:hypothetical protein